MWERTLQDLIRGLRANKGDENKFVQKAIDEIRVEVKGKDMQLKAAAVLKLTYLDMLGYDMSWASFYVVEVMSSPRYHLKNIGHLAACQSFTPQTDVLMLTTNLLKKEMSAPPVELSLSLNTLSHIMTPDLARDLAHELVTLLTHSRAHIRKRAVVAVFNVCSQYPEVLPAAFSRLRAMLEDPDPGVVVATVNVLTELARKDAASYLNLAPQLFHILTTSSNNWVLIKTMKLFACLAPLEPRLVKKLQAPMSDLISTTTAISLLYECVRTCITGGMLSGSSGHSLARACVDKLSGFLQNDDQNLRYIALVALLKLVPTHPYMAAEYEEMIMTSIDEPDISIRMRALDLVSAMATRDNLQSLVARLLVHLVPSSTPLPSATSALAAVQSSTSVAPTTSPSMSPSYRAHLTLLILSLGSRDTYSLVTDFHWYLSVLADLTYVSNAPGVGAEIARQLVDVVVRAQTTRRFAVELMTRLLSDENLVLRANEDDSCPEVLGAAAWICGEYCSDSTDRKVLLYYLTRPAISSLPLSILSLYLHSTLKVYGSWASDLANRWDVSDLTELNRVVDMITDGMKPFAASDDIEVQERAANALQLFAFIRADLSSYKKPEIQEAESTEGLAYPKSLFLIRPLFSAFELNAVAPQAQASVPVPEGLRLNEWIVPPEMDDHDMWDGEADDAVGEQVKGVKKTGKKRRVKKSEAAPKVETEEERREREKRRAARQDRLRGDPYYIRTDTPSGSHAAQTEDVDSIPVVQLQLDDIMAPAASPAVDLTPANEHSQQITGPLIDTEGEMPERAKTNMTSEELHEELPPITVPSPPQPPVARPIPSIAQYEIPEEGVSTPEPIRVSRLKKQGAKKKKKVTATA
ncbi:Adaptor protein complex AP-3 delta subunit [Calocera viscosa TUFC12733]|uniref:AP-3 complex subunit delta n=1 Tax=Calocera viscosa (strain TUFC12733) TaxID=1330018 RepID=A0A167JZM4_CALVF|nr:Adaptor protein complex AP-3 delta subunit [Calocera viscosa TUFC12733]